MSTLINEYRVVTSMFFWLNIPEPTLRKILLDAEFTEVTPPPPRLSLTPGLEIALGSPRKSLASYKSVRISWDDIKFLLALEGVVKDVAEALRAIEPSFNKHGYPLNKICHYYEVNFTAQPLDIDNFINKLRKKVNVELKIDDNLLKPFSISFSNTDEPISREHFYKWLHISINPDVNATQKRVFIQIIKRDIDFHSMLKFIENIDKTLELIKGFFA